MKSIEDVKTKDGLTPDQIVESNKDVCDKMVEKYYKEYKFHNDGFILKDLSDCYNECKHDFVRINSKEKRWNELLLELASRMVAIKKLTGNKPAQYHTHFDSLKAIKEQLFDAPSDVKENFNKVVEYFGKGGKGKYFTPGLTKGKLDHHFAVQETPGSDWEIFGSSKSTIEELRMTEGKGKGSYLKNAKIIKLD